jgi:N-acetyltransferase 10
MGYGGRAMDLLVKYYSGQLASLDEAAAAAGGGGGGGGGSGGGHKGASGDDGKEGGLLGEKVAARKALPPLLVPVSQRRAEPLDYLGVSFGLTAELHRFWRY